MNASPAGYMAYVTVCFLNSKTRSRDWRVPSFKEFCGHFNKMPPTPLGRVNIIQKKKRLTFVIFSSSFHGLSIHFILLEYLIFKKAAVA
jgi:hypothetical protein